MGQFMLTFTQLCNAKNKIRVKSRIKLGDVKYQIDVGCDSYTNEEQDTKGDLLIEIENLFSDPNNNFDFSDGSVANQFRGILYISGAIAFKIEKKFGC